MKLHIFFIIVVIFLSSVQISLAQSSNNPVLLDSLVRPNCEDLLSRLDFLANEIRKNVASVGYVVIRGGKNPIENHFYKNFINFYRQTRELRKEELAVITTNEENLEIELWISKNGKKPEINEENFTYILPSQNPEHHFAGESLEIMDVDGKATLVGDCPACCIETFNLGLLSKILEANPNLNARIVIENKSNRRQFNHFAKLLSDEAAKDYKIPGNRLRIIYGGHKEGIYVWNKNMASVNVTLFSNAKKNP